MTPEQRTQELERLNTLRHPSTALWSDLANAQAEHIAKQEETIAKLAEVLTWHVDVLDLGCISFYDKHGFNAALIFPRTRETLKSIGAV